MGVGELFVKNKRAIFLGGGAAKVGEGHAFKVVKRKMWKLWYNYIITVISPIWVLGTKLSGLHTLSLNFPPE